MSKNKEASTLPLQKINQSVSLKIGPRSVALFCNRYEKSSNRQGGRSVQQYLGSFSSDCTEIPADFLQLLRDNTLGRQDRFDELIKRIETRVLQPAREQKRLLEQQQQKQRLVQLLSVAHSYTTEVAQTSIFNESMHDANVQELVSNFYTTVSGLQEQKNRLLEQGTESTEVELLPEQKLQQLLQQHKQICDEICTMMPVAAGSFARGYEFEELTVDLVKTLWFSNSEVISLLNRRNQLKRPANWSKMNDVELTSTDEE